MRRNSAALMALVMGAGMGIGGLPAVLRLDERPYEPEAEPQPERIRPTKPHQGKREIARRLRQMERQRAKEQPK